MNKKFVRFIEDINCPQCLKKYNDPRSLPCGDSLCAKCIQSLSSNHKHKFVCPTCSILTLTPFGGFPANNALVKLLDRFDIISSVKNHTNSEISISNQVRPNRRLLNRLSEKKKDYKNFYNAMIDSLGQLNSRANEMLEHYESSSIQNPFLNGKNEIEKMLFHLQRFYNDVVNYANNFEFERISIDQLKETKSTATQSYPNNDNLPHNHMHQIELKDVLLDYYYTRDQIEFKYGIKIEAIDEDIFILGFKTKQNTYRLIIYDGFNECLIDQIDILEENYMVKDGILVKNRTNIFLYIHFESKKRHCKYKLISFDFNLEKSKEIEIEYAIESMTANDSFLYCLLDNLTQSVSSRLLIYDTKSLRLAFNKGQFLDPNQPYFIAADISFIRHFKDCLLLKDEDKNKILFMELKSGKVIKELNTSHVSSFFLFDQTHIVEYSSGQLLFYEFSKNEKKIKKNEFESLSETAHLVNILNDNLIFFDTNDLSLKIFDKNYFFSQ